jgi:hypothetical protein
MSIFDKFDKQVDQEEIKRKMKEAKENGGGNREIPVGNYFVSIEKIEPKETKTGHPMISIWMNILEGEFKNSKMFHNLVIQVGGQWEGLQRNNAIDFIDSLGTGIDNINPHSIGHLATWAEEVFDEIEAKGFEYDLAYSKNKKGYDVYKIEEVFLPN